MHLAYRGRAFHGWQSQPNAVSVQSTIEDALVTIMRESIKIVGAGRTDAGVNAHSMIAHFDVSQPIANPDAVVRGLNSLVGHDIAIYSIKQVQEDAHARFDANSRTYHYYTHTTKSPFCHELSWQAPASLNYEKMNEAAKILLEVDDFTSFAKLHADNKTNICKVSYAKWESLGNGRWVFIITADRFLRNMVRAVVGTLVEVGRGKITIDDFRRIIDEKDRCSAGTSMPGHALFLWEVKYPYYQP